ncbi:MAG: mechanosensitive ion channel family protein [Bacteroidetes bacterium]|nr:mechanosensitive ion channel family protein [Bacteroidota bacterium]
MINNISNAYNLLIDKLDSWLNTAISMLPNFVIAIGALLLIMLMGKLLRKVLRKALDKVSGNIAVNRLIESLIKIIFLIVGLFVALGIMNLDKTVTSLLAGVGIIGLALGFAFQDAASNFISGIYLAIRSPINVGDLIEVNDKFGTVKKIGLRATTILSFQGQDIVVPNRLIFEDSYTHYTINGEQRIDLEVGVSYGDDLEKVEKVTLAAINSLDFIKKDKPVDLFYNEFGNSSINFIVRYWVNMGKRRDYLKGLSEGVKAIKKAYDENDITIPFPIRTLDFGIKGGEKLSEMWPKNLREIN